MNNLKNEIFAIFESARILFNDYYNGKNELYIDLNDDKQIFILSIKEM